MKRNGECVLENTVLIGTIPSQRGSCMSKAVGASQAIQWRGDQRQRRITMTKLNRIAGAAGVLAVALMAASVPLKSASADNDNWGRHRNWNGDWNSGGSFYFNTGPGYYYSPPPTYYYPPPP